MDLIHVSTSSTLGNAPLKTGEQRLKGLQKNLPVPVFKNDLPRIPHPHRLLGNQHSRQ